MIPDIEKMADNRIEDDKMIVQHVENSKIDASHSESQVDDPKVKAGDYSGARSKTDATEIRLVRKIDLILMPTIW